MRWLLAPLFPILFCHALKAQQFLDPSWGIGGMVRFNLNNTLDRFFDIAEQTDGKGIAVGASNSFNSTGTIVRFNTDGSLDPSWGQNGVDTFSIGYYNTTTYSVFIQPDGKVVAAGEVNSDSYTHPFIARFLSNGAPDISFGNSGIFEVSSLTNAEFAHIALGSDGSIIAVGRVDTGSTEILVMHFHSNGTKDLTFGINGIKVLNTVSTNAIPNGVAITPSGKFVISGTDNNQGKAIVVRLNINGELDPSFNGSGIYVHNEQSIGHDMTLRANGKVVVTGATFATWPFPLLMFQLDADGTRDATFGNDGIVHLDLGSRSASGEAPIALQGDGLLVGGTALQTQGVMVGQFYFTRITPTGQLDSSFGDQGFVRDTLDACLDVDPLGALLSTSGRMYVCGTSAITSDGDALIAAFLPSAVGIDEASTNTTDLQLFPDPARDRTTLQLPCRVNGSVHVELFDPLGRVERSFTFFDASSTHAYELSLEGMPPGFYGVHVISALGPLNWCGRLVVE